MPSKVRDIAKFVGQTENSNRTNFRLKTSEEGGALEVYDSIDLLPTSGLSAGDQAFVSSNNRLYVSNGSGWYNVALVNATPVLSVSQTGTIALTPGSATNITVTATDSDNSNATLSLLVESGGDFFKFATLSQDSSVYTITPRTEDSAVALGSDGSATLTFKASDGISQATVQNTFTLAFSVNWSSVSFTTNSFYSYDPAGGSASYDYYGMGLRITKDNERVITSASQGNGGGGIFIYKRNGATYANEQGISKANLTVSPAASGSSAGGFGNDFDVDDTGDRAVIGWTGFHTGSNSNHGAIVIIKRTSTTWAAETSYLYQNQSANNAYFGYRCCMDGTGTYVVAFQSHLGSLYGAGHLYKRTGTSWAYVGSFVGSGIAGGDQFGLSGGRMDATGTRIAVLSKSSAGKLWIMRRDSTNFSNTELATGDLGNVRSCSINADGSYVVVGDDANKNVFIYVRSGTTWSLQQTVNVTAVADGTTAYNFGYSVDIDDAGETLVIGNRDSLPSTIWVYTRSGTTWSKQREIDERALDTTGDPNFRSFGEVAINGDADTILGGGWYVTLSGSGQAGPGIMKTYTT